MWRYSAPLREMQFVIDEWVGAARDWREIPAFASLDGDSVRDILAEAARFAEDVLAPANATGDREGCHWNAGQVSTPTPFPAAYRQFCDAGWPTIACAEEDGGQGLPQLLNAIFYEMCYAANHAWAMYPGLAHGAYECIRNHGSDALKATYLPKVVSGEWLATMCLSEPHAGTDLGLIKTQAVAGPDGGYALTGTKIFISGGEHDLTANIVHLVLARLPDAPAGSRGISLFLVPKRLGADGEGPVNGVYCDGIERKMGIKGSATCVMRFDAAQAWLLGEPNRGLAAMFVMMNSARLYVGMQGLGHAEAAYQNAYRYAAERKQMRLTTPPPAGMAIPTGPAVPILMHPGIRRSLMQMKVVIEGERAMAYWAGHLLDLAEHHPSETRRRESHDHVSLLTPIIKAMYTDNGFNLASQALQIWGGYGYLQDYGVEQTVRDSRIAMIYEGTNDVQAIDLVVRKVVVDGGAKLKSLLVHLSAESVQAQECGPLLQRLAQRLHQLHAEIVQITDFVSESTALDPEFPLKVGGDFLRLVGLGLMASFWCRAARVCESRATDDRFSQEKLSSAECFFDSVLPETNYRLELIRAGRSSLPWMDAPLEG